MAHPQDAEAVDVPEIQTDDDALAALEGHLDEGGEDDIVGDGDGEGEGPEADDIDDDGDDEDEQDGDEPEGAIEAPVSLNADEKAVFAQLPPEAQRAWSASETRRNGQVQEATTKAANAQRAAEQQAATAQSEAQQLYAEQLAKFASALAPTAPDPSIARDDPATYIALKAQYDADSAQYDQFVQQVQALGADAGAQADQAFIQQRDGELLAIPEVANAETRDAYFASVFETAEALGLSPQDVARNAGASEIKALAQVAGFKAKADKYDALMAKQMQRVRDAKTVRPGAAQPKGAAKDRNISKKQERLRQTGSDADAVALFEAMEL